jgi:hypothetical protein
MCVVVAVQSLHEASSDDHLWRRFCSPHSPLQVATTPWKAQYMSWLQPRLKQYSAHKSTILVVVVVVVCLLSSSSTLIETKPTGKGSLSGAAASSIKAPASAGYDYLFKFLLAGDAGKFVSHSTPSVPSAELPYADTLAGLGSPQQAWARHRSTPGSSTNPSPPNGTTPSASSSAAGRSSWAGDE